MKCDKEMTNEEKIARMAFAKIFAKFPNLEVIEDINQPVEISLTIPVQPNLKYKVWLCLQNNDELHLGICNFWCAWFPCENEEKVSEYIDAVCGFLSGEYRIIEYFIGNICIKAELQKPKNDSWEKIASCSNLGTIIPWKRTHKEIQNYRLLQ